MKNEWNFKPLNEVVEILDKKRKPINSKQRSLRILGKSNNELYPYYGATGQVGVIDYYLFDGEYVLLGEDGAPFLDAFADKAYIISGKSWVNNHAHILRSNYNNKFLCYYLNCFNYKDYVSGTTRLKLTQADMKRIPVPVPTISEQKQIVQQIEEQLSQLDRAVETLKKTKQQLEVYRQAVLKEAFSFNDADQLVEISQITDSIRIGPFGTMLHKSDYITNGIPVINPQHIKNGVIVPNPKNSISIEKAKELNNYQLKSNDIIMGRRGEMGRTAPVTDVENGWLCGTGSIFFRLKQDFDASLYSKILSSPSIVHYLEENATGTTMKNLNEDIVSHIPVPYIDKSKQNQIMQRLEERLSVCKSIETTINQSLQQAEALRQSILKQAFEGML